MVGAEELIDIINKDKRGFVEKWVCDYRLTHMLNAIRRDLKPVYARLMINNEGYKDFIVRNLKTQKKMEFWSGETFCKGLHYFDTEEECINEYNALLVKAYKDLHEHQQYVITRTNELMAKTEKQFIGTDLVMEVLTKGEVISG